MNVAAKWAVFLLAVFAIAAGLWRWAARDRDPAGTEIRAMLNEYCVDCHNPLEFAGSLRLDAVDVAHVEPDAAVWERVVRKLKTGMMPPADMPRPALATIDRVVDSIEFRLDAAAENGHKAAPSLRRLNRTEYANAVRELLHFDIDVATLLPLDDSSEGFDNMATALGMSPSLVEAYVSAAMKISRGAIGDRTAPQTLRSYGVPQGLSQAGHIDGLPLGTRGGLAVEHFFPLDAEYIVTVRRGFRFPPGAVLDFTIDGRPIELGSERSARLTIPAGPHRLAAAIVDTRRPVGVDDVYAEFDVPGSIQSIDIDGPLQPVGPGDTPSRRRILVCDPSAYDDERVCAAEILEAIATRAFRRPVSPETLSPFLGFFDQVRDQGFEAGIQNALARVLVDPRFLYRVEREPAELSAGSRFSVDDFDLATRLSFFLWSSIPDDELLHAAATGQLQDRSAYEAQVRRMLSDPRAAALVENFAAQWLFIREIDSVTPDASAFDDNLRLAMARESKMLFEDILRADLSIERLLDAEFTFIDERLAKHYGFVGVHGSHFRRVQIPPDDPRRGILGHASVLTVTSVTNRTSPVIRGSWILENLLGTPPPVPPPNVETTLAGDDGAAVAATVRQRLEAHRANPVCASCHAIMDPMGFTLENFDLIGRWRETDAGSPIDSAAVLADGTVIDGPAGLRQALLARSEAFVETAVEKLLTYAIGRPVEHGDMPIVRRIVRDADAADYRLSALVLGVVNSELFLTQVKGGGE